jgi:hypothetical protein
MQVREDRDPYRDDVREVLGASGWRENAEGCVVAPNGALWTETNDALDSGVDAPGKAWSVSLDSSVPASVIAATALAASGVDVSQLLADNARLQERVAGMEDDVTTLRALHAAGVDGWEGYEGALELRTVTRQTYDD